jgi:uncharacterized protein (TIGR00730 family)
MTMPTASAAGLRRICVYCGSRKGHDERYVAATRELGRLLAERGIGLVYGGASVGLMGILADAALQADGEVIGVIPDSLRRSELAHRNLAQLHVTASMHERKAMMLELADAFIALPGGIGTLDEFFEVWTWAQLGLHQKPCGLLDIAGYYGPLLQFLDDATEAGFIAESVRALLTVEQSSSLMLAALAARHVRSER